jgi:hypothetical protein
MAVDAIGLLGASSSGRSLVLLILFDCLRLGRKLQLRLLWFRLGAILATEELAVGVLEQSSVAHTARVGCPHPKVCCEDLTYPNVTCLGGMIPTLFRSVGDGRQCLRSVLESLERMSGSGGGTELKYKMTRETLCLYCEAQNERGSTLRDHSITQPRLYCNK